MLARTVLAVAALLWGSLVAPHIHAQTPAPARAWPQRSVKLIVPLGPGAGSDVTARLLADRLTRRWHEPVVVENRPGGDGIVAISAFVAAHDDHVLLFAPTSTFTPHPFLHRIVPYNLRDLAPIARVTNTLVVIAVPAALHVGGLGDLVTLARAEPGKLNRASITGALDLIMDGFLDGAGLAMARVPYRDPVQAVNDLAEGRIQLYTSALAIVQPQMQAGRVKVLAVTNGARSPAAPTIPTVAEAGYPELGFDGLVGLFGPPDMAPELRERIAADLRDVVAEPDTRKLLVATGQVVNPGTGAELGEAVDAQRAKLAAIAKRLDVKPED